MVVPGAELTGGEEVEMSSIQQDALGDDLLKEFATALQEGYRTVGLCNLVIYFTRLWDRDDHHILPWMVTPGDCSIKQGGEVGRCGCMAPL